MTGQSPQYALARLGEQVVIADLRGSRYLLANPAGALLVRSATGPDRPGPPARAVLLGLPRICRLLGIGLDLRDRPAGGRLVLPGWARRRVAAVGWLARHRLASNCLRRSLLLGLLLRRLHPQLRLGVMRHDGALRMHAWLEIEGHPLDPVAASYVPFLAD